MLYNLMRWAAGGFLVYVMGILYMFVGIAIVCDDFFVASLEAISEALNLSEDVAGENRHSHQPFKECCRYIARHKLSSLPGTVSAVIHIMFGIVVCRSYFHGSRFQCTRALLIDCRYQ